MNVGAPELLILLAMGGIIVAGLMAARATSSPTPVPVGPVMPVVVDAPADQVLARIVQLLAANGALVTSQSPTSVSGHVMTKKKPSVLVAILLWFVCIIPMVIYLINGSKDVQEPFSMSLTPVSGGTRIDGAGTGRGLAAVHWILDQLRSPVSAPVLDAAAGTSPSPAALGAQTAPELAPSSLPGWYPEPHGGEALRWWDGAAWTDHRHET